MDDRQGGEPGTPKASFPSPTRWKLVLLASSAAALALMVAAAVFFFVVKPANMLMQRAKSEPPADPTAKKCAQCLSEIPIEATRCAFCTQPV